MNFIAKESLLIFNNLIFFLSLFFSILLTPVGLGLFLGFINIVFWFLLYCDIVDFFRGENTERNLFSFVLFFLWMLCFFSPLYFVLNKKEIPIYYILKNEPITEISNIGAFENNVLFRYLPEERKKELKKITTEYEIKEKEVRKKEVLISYIQELKEDSIVIEDLYNFLNLKE